MIEQTTTSLAVLFVDDDAVEGAARPALERQAQRFRDLAGASRRVYAALSVDKALALTVSEARRLLGAAIAMGRVDEPGGERREQVSLGSTYDSIEQVPMADLTWLDVPLLSQDGTPWGSLRVGAAPGALFRPSDGPILAEFAESAVIAIDRARVHAALRDTARAREDLLAMVSHDLRNPLNTISMSIALLRQDVAPRDLPLVERIHRAMNRMNRLIGDLLDATSVDQGRLQVTPRREPAASIVTEAVDAAAPMAAARGCRIESSLPDGAAFVLADRDRLLQVLSSLLGNAIKFSPAAGVVTASLAQDGGFAVFSVADQGPGIEAKHVERLFGRYYKVNPALRDGVGLGLFIARGIVEAHHGQIRVESTPGQGTQFSFSIPLAPGG